MRACPVACAEGVARSEEQGKRLDPFQLSKIIYGRLDRIYRQANHRLSPKEIQRTETGRGSGQENGCGKWKSKPDFPFPADTATTGVRLHFKCRDRNSQPKPRERQSLDWRGENAIRENGVPSSVRKRFVLF
jgi:hypothetical protein